MTNYYLQPPQDPPEKPAWQIAKEQRKKLLEEVQARRRERYKQFLQKLRNCQLQAGGDLL